MYQILAFENVNIPDPNLLKEGSIVDNVEQTQKCNGNTVSACVQCMTAGEYKDVLIGMRELMVLTTCIDLYV